MPVSFFNFIGNEVSYEVKTLRVAMRSYARGTKAVLPRNQVAGVCEAHFCSSMGISGSDRDEKNNYFFIFLITKYLGIASLSGINYGISQ